MPSLQDVQARLVAWLQKHYHCTPHAGLMGKTPSEVYEGHARTPMSDVMLREALIVRAQRRVRRDGDLRSGDTGKLHGGRDCELLPERTVGSSRRVAGRST